MTKRLLKPLLLPFIALAMAFAFISCGGETPAITYTVTYVIGENAQGTAPVETDKAIGEKFKIKSADGITCEGMTFAGWKDVNDIVYKPDDEYTMPSKAVVFTALWQPNGEEGEQKPNEGEQGGEGEEKPSEGEQKPAAKYTVTYKHGAAKDDNGDSVADITAANQAAGSYTVGDPAQYYYADEEQAFYLFSGWVNEKNKNDDNPTVYLPGQTMTLAKNTTLEAVWVVADEYVYMTADTSDTVFLYAYPNGIGAYWHVDAQDQDKEVWTFFTYTLDGTTIKATPVGGAEVTGTFANGGLTMSIQIGMLTYYFEPKQVQPQGVPKFTFQLNGGTGTLPTLTVTEDMKKGDYYMVPMPANTITPPAGKAFKRWTISDGTGTWNTNAGSKFSADPGVTYTVKPEWEDSGEPTIEGVEFYGNCKLPTTTGIGGISQGGETVVKIIIDKSDAQNIKIYYNLQNDDTDYLAKGVGPNSYLPAEVYGDDALYYDLKIENVLYSVVINADYTKLSLCDQNKDEPFADGEFTTEGWVVTPVTYTVTYVKPSGVEGEVPAVATVESGEQVTLELGTVFTKAGWTFAGWAVTGYSSLRAADTKIDITQNTTITPVFSVDYNGQYGIITVLDNDTLIIVDFGDTCGYTRNGNIVVIDYDGLILTAKVDDAAKTYVMLDGMQAVTYTAANNTTLTFDGCGVATLGAHTGTYTLSEDYDKFTLVIGGNTYANIAIGTTINVTITIDDTDYVFGNSSSGEEPNDPTVPTGLLAEYVGGSSSTAVQYGYASVDAAQAAKQNITATNVNSAERTFYKASVYKSGANNLCITINANIGSVSNPKDKDNANYIVVVDDTPNQKAYITSASWANQFVITFSKNSDGKRVMTITYGDITVSWVEMTTA